MVVIGGGFGGATAARYLKLWAPDIDVTVVERNETFVSCPMSNLVLGGNTQIGNITLGYDGLRKRGVRIVRDEAVAVDAGARQVRLAERQDALLRPADRLARGSISSTTRSRACRAPMRRSRVLHAWKAGPQTVALRKQLEAMPDGGVFVIHIPMAPYRCPPGPYERVCQVADYFKRAKPKSKIIVLDSNPDIVSKKGLFLAAWNGLYKGMIDYRPEQRARRRRREGHDGEARVRQRQGRRAERRAAAARGRHRAARPASSPPTSTGAAWTG